MLFLFFFDVSISLAIRCIAFFATLWLVVLATIVRLFAHHFLDATATEEMAEALVVT